MKMGGRDKEIRQLKLTIAEMKDTLKYEHERYETCVKRNQTLMKQVTNCQNPLSSKRFITGIE